MTTVLTVLVLLFTLEPLKSFTCYPCHPQFHPSSPSTIAGSPIGSFAHFKTPRLENLVLKVEVWELLTHVVEEFPSCLSKGTVGPLNEDFSDSIWPPFMSRPSKIAIGCGGSVWRSVGGSMMGVKRGLATLLRRDTWKMRCI